MHSLAPFLIETRLIASPQSRAFAIHVHPHHTHTLSHVRCRPLHVFRCRLQVAVHHSFQHRLALLPCLHPCYFQLPRVSLRDPRQIPRERSRHNACRDKAHRDTKTHTVVRCILTPAILVSRTSLSPTCRCAASANTQGPVETRQTISWKYYCQLGRLTGVSYKWFP